MDSLYDRRGRNFHSTMSETVSPETDSFRNQNPPETKGGSLHKLARGSPPKQQEQKGTGGKMANGNAETVLKIVVAALLTAIIGYGLGRMDSLAAAPWLQERAEVNARIEGALRASSANEKNISELKVLLESNNRIGNLNSNRLTWMETVLQTMAENQGVKIPRPPSGERN